MVVNALDFFVIAVASVEVTHVACVRNEPGSDYAVLFSCGGRGAPAQNVQSKLVRHLCGRQRRLRLERLRFEYRGFRIRGARPTLPDRSHTASISMAPLAADRSGSIIASEHLSLALRRISRAPTLTATRRRRFVNPPVVFPFTYEASTKIDWFGTVRGRIGVTCDRTLFYFTGGYAYGDVRIQMGDISFRKIGAYADLHKGGTQDGYVLGGGVEHKLDKSWSLKLEYQYLNLGSEDVEATTSSSRWQHDWGSRQIELRRRPPHRARRHQLQLRPRRAARAPPEVAGAPDAGARETLTPSTGE